MYRREDTKGGPEQVVHWQMQNAILPLGCIGKLVEAESRFGNLAFWGDMCQIFFWENIEFLRI